MTTLELAEEVALAVQEAVVRAERGEYPTCTPTQAVLRTLHEHQSWFCRLTLTEDNQQMHHDTLEEPYELVQMDLFGS